MTSETLAPVLYRHQRLGSVVDRPRADDICHWRRLGPRDRLDGPRSCNPRNGALSADPFFYAGQLPTVHSIDEPFNKPLRVQPLTEVDRTLRETLALP
jgi:hypothetical protein